MYFSDETGKTDTRHFLKIIMKKKRGIHHSLRKNASERVKERVEAGGPSVAIVRQPAFWHFVQPNFVGRAFFSCANLW